MEWIADHWPYLIIPFVSGLIGWFTNYMALKMTFHPLERRGFGPISWQGIIPSRSEKMASKAVDLIAGKLLSVREVFEKLDAKVISNKILPKLTRVVNRILAEELKRETPQIWKHAPELSKRELYDIVGDELPGASLSMIEDVQNHIEEVFDLKGMVVDMLQKDKSLLNEIFKKSGKEEFKFIERSGFYFGFGLGIVQAFLMYLAHSLVFADIVEVLVLPIAGLLVGWATNYFALKMIFEPARPRNFFFFSYQGLFLKRQYEVAADYADVVGNKILTPGKIFSYIVSGPKSDPIIVMTQRHVARAFDHAAGFFEPVLKMIAGGNKLAFIRERTTNRIISAMMSIVEPSLEYSKSQMDIEETLKNKMRALSSEEFEGFLRPIFEEDEWKLILTGAILGFLAGFAQLLLFFPESWRMVF